MYWCTRSGNRYQNLVHLLSCLVNEYASSLWNERKSVRESIAFPVASYMLRTDLVAGGILQILNLTHNLGRFGNGIDLWLSMQPAEIFFYIFLPPLLLDSAVRIDFFVFKKVGAQGNLVCCKYCPHVLTAYTEKCVFIRVNHIYQILERVCVCS